MRRRETSAEIDEIAASWAARLDGGWLDPAERQRLESWLDGDERRPGALARAQAVLDRTGIAAALGSDFIPERAPWRPTRRHFLQASGASAAIAASGAWIFLAKAAEAYSTRKGEVRLVPLRDGSTITLNTDSSVNVLFDKSHRLVTLITGEVLFEVAKDRERPFIVEAGSTRVQAIGTAFTVRNTIERPVVVAVKEGVVEMSSQHQAFTPLRLKANMKATTEGEQTSVQTSMLDPTDVDSELAWREGKIAFRGETLQVAADEFSRYSATRLVLDNPEIASRKVTGYFSATDVPGFARAVGASLNLQVAIEDTQVVLSEPQLMQR